MTERFDETLTDKVSELQKALDNCPKSRKNYDPDHYEWEEWFKNCKELFSGFLKGKVVVDKATYDRQVKLREAVLSFNKWIIEHDGRGISSEVHDEFNERLRECFKGSTEASEK